VLLQTKSTVVLWITIDAAKQSCPGLCASHPSSLQIENNHHLNKTFWHITHKYIYGSGSIMTRVRSYLQKTLDSNVGRVVVSSFSHCVQMACQAQAASKSDGTQRSLSWTDNRLGCVIIRPHLMSKWAACGALPTAPYLFIMCCLVF